MTRSKWFCGLLFVLTSVLCLVLCGSVFSEDKITVDKKEYSEFRLMKIQQELNQINADLRKKNPAEFQKIDSLVAEAQKIQKEMQPQAPAKVEKKK